MRKLFTILTLIVIVVSMAAFVGCQKESEKAAESEKSEETAEKPEGPIAPPEKSTTIDMIGWAFPITEFYAEELESFNSVDNLKVNTQLLDSASAQEQVRLGLSGGKESPYAIVHASNSQMNEWGFNGWLMPLDDLIDEYGDEYDLEDIPDQMWEAATIDGQVMGIPITSNTFQLIYREDLFEKHGIDVPETYDEVISASQELRENENSINVPFTLNLHAGWAWEIEFLHFLRAFGGKYINDDNTCAFNSEAGVKALEMMKRVANEAMGDAGMSYSIDDSEIGLQTGRLAFANIWASRAAGMLDPEKSNYPDELKFAPSPRPKEGGPRGASTYNDFYCIPKTTEVDKELIFKVIMEATDLESQKEAAGYGIPTRQKAVQSEQADPYMPSAMESIAEGVGAYQVSPANPIARTALGEFLPLVGTGELSPKEALTKAEEKFNEEAKAQGYID
jgi:ABC-type glycerol-3-phosphate transport system substrate-binding protein